MLDTSIPSGLERRREDYRLITGSGHYVDDLRSPQGRPPALYMVAVRSPYAHAEITGILAARQGRLAQANVNPPKFFETNEGTQKEGVLDFV